MVSETFKPFNNDQNDDNDAIVGIAVVGVVVVGVVVVGVVVVGVVVVGVVVEVDVVGD
jgi:hypothetical protein